MSSIHLALAVHHRALRRTRGVACCYYRAGSTEPAPLLLVPGRTDAETLADADAGLSGRTRDWLELRQDLLESLGRLPEAEDRLVELDSSGEPAREWRVAKLGEAREWADADTHGVVVRFHTLEVPLRDSDDA
jgi:hypothetical protein